MNILQEIDSTLHYENIEKAWHKYKYVMVLSLVALFGSVAAFNAYNAKMLTASEHDAGIVFNTMINKAAVKDQADVIIPALDTLVTTQAKDMLTLELAKSYKSQNQLADYEKTLVELTNAKTKAVKQLAVYMLAEYYLAIKPTQALEFIEQTNLSKKAFTYSLVQELKAMALVATGETKQAKDIYTALSADANLSADLKARVKLKLSQLN